MFSYVDFGFMLDFIVFIMRSLVVSERCRRCRRRYKELSVLSDGDCLPTPPLHNSYQSANWSLLALIQLTSFVDITDMQTKHLILSDTTTGSLAVVTVEL